MSNIPSRFGRSSSPAAKKEVLALTKHVGDFHGTEYQRCETCPGCSPRVFQPVGEKGAEEMKVKVAFCSRVDGYPRAITPEQSRKCDGTKPYVSKKVSSNTTKHHHGGSGQDRRAALRF
jgi:hypothetical protein